MSKNKFKVIVFMGVLVANLLLSCKIIKAIEYEVEIQGLENLTYGNELEEVKVIGNSQIEGKFSIENSNRRLDEVGEIDLVIKFDPTDSSYESKIINYPATVEPKKVEIIFADRIYKQYDGTSEIKLPDYSYIGIIEDEVEVEGKITGSLLTTYPSENVPLTLGGIHLEGEKKDCYQLVLDGHEAIIYPAKLEKGGDNATIITLPKNLYIDVNYILKVNNKEENRKVNDLYTSFLSYSYQVFNHSNIELKLNSKVKFNMVVSSYYMNKERLKLFELTSDGEYKEIEYRYINGRLLFEMESDSQLVLATRNIEYDFIVFFSSILVISVGLGIVYYRKNSKIKSKDKSEVI